MGEVSILVAGRAYQVICEDGEEDRLKAIAARVDTEAQAFGGATPSLSEARLLLMCSLLLADKLDEAEKAPQPKPDVAAVAAEAADIDTSEIEHAVERIVALTQSAEADGSDNQAPAADASPVVEPVTDEAPPPKTERRAKSSAATAAEKDLLSWLDRPEPSASADELDDDEASDATTATEDADAVESDSNPELAVAASPEEKAEAEPEEIEPEESEEERTSRERSERRNRRRERLARLARNVEDDS